MVNEIETILLKIEEFKNDFEKRTSSLAIDTDLNKTLFANSKVWLFSSLSSMIKNSLEVFNGWRENSQKNVESMK